MEKKIFIHSLIIPGVFIFMLWLSKFIEIILNVQFYKFGVYPLTLKGLPGIILSPFIHSNFNHLISNSVPLMILFSALIYYYRRISYRIFFQLYLLSGIMVWAAGRGAWHIGASGIVYALSTFHFVSGVIRNDTRLLTLSIIVVFLYGSLIWGIFPIDPKISWEGHFWGAFWGVILAVYYRKYSIRRYKFHWEEEEEDEDDEGTIFKEESIGSDEQNDSNSTRTVTDEDPFNSRHTSHTGQFRS